MLHPWPFAQLDAPIVLAHGLGGFSRIGVGRMTLTTYFRGIPEALRASGNRVLVTRVPPLAGIAKRARKLGEQIVRAFGDEPVHLIGHSMGGLDSRQLLADPAWQGRVLSLTTIGTPHLGSSLADFAKIRVGRIYDMLAAVGIDPQGCLDVTCAAARRFHEQTPLPSGVRCFCVAGDPMAEAVGWPLRRLHAVLGRLEGPNDGLVSVASANAFGTPLPAWPADHFQQLNWVAHTERSAITPNPLELYAQVVAHLASLGFGNAPDANALCIGRQTALLVPGASSPKPTSLAG
jgi:triacylglycerol lipase